MARTYNIGDELDVRIAKIVPRGLGLAFAEELTVFVPLAAVGDRMRVRIDQLKKRTAFADIVSVIEASPDRTGPACPYYGICGGCDMQHLSYAAQLRAKSGIVRDCLHRIGKIDLDEVDIIGCPEELGYRSRARWHLEGEGRRIGYFARASHEVVDVAACPILTPDLQTGLTAFRENIDWGLLWSASAEVDAASDDHATSLFSPEMAEPTVELGVDIGGEHYSYSAESFFQGNRVLAERLIDLAVGDTGGETALDLYCGVGLFTLPLARRFGRIDGVEGNVVAAEYARKNALNAGLANIEIHERSVRHFLSENVTATPGLVLIDPPRVGAEKGTIEAIAAMRPRAISYVSCEPSILARDLRILLDRGYAIERLTAIDLFPQSHHVETVVRLGI